MPEQDGGDVRWLIGGTIILANWPYAYFVMVPVNVWLCGHSTGKSHLAGAQTDAGLGAAGMGARLDGLAATCVFAWALDWPP